MNGSVKPGYPHAEERNWTLISHHIQKSTQNRLGLNIRPETTIRKHISIFIIMLETQATKAKKKKKVGLYQTKNFFTVKERTE